MYWRFRRTLFIDFFTSFDYLTGYLFTNGCTYLDIRKQGHLLSLMNWHFVDMKALCYSGENPLVFVSTWYSSGSNDGTTFSTSTLSYSPFKHHHLHHQLLSTATIKSHIILPSLVLYDTCTYPDTSTVKIRYNSEVPT